MAGEAPPTQWSVTWEGGWNTGFSGERAIAGAHDVSDVLSLRDANGDAEFTIAPVTTSHPQLVVNVHAERCYLHCFSDDDDPGSLVVGDDLSSEEFWQMPAGSNIEVSAANLVSVETAVQAAIEFVTSGARPETLEWSDF